MRRILAIGPIPPPINGAALAHASVCDQLSTRASLRIVNTSSNLRATLPYHLHRQIRHLLAAIAIVRFRDRDGSTCVYMASPGGYALWYVIALTALARMLGCDILLHHQSYAYISKRSIAMQSLVRVAGARGRHVLLCTRMRDRFDEIYTPNAPSTVSSNSHWIKFGLARASGTDSSSQKSAARPLRIGHLGTLTYDKGVFELPELLTSLVADGIDSELWLAGGPATKRDRTMLKAALTDLGPNARWLGVLEGREKAKFFRDIDIFVLPTRYRHEAQPLVLFEALRFGVPVVSYGTGCIPEQLRSCGLLVPQSEQLAQRALPFIRDLAVNDTAYAAERDASLQAFRVAESEGAAQADALLAQLSG